MKKKMTTMIFIIVFLAGLSLLLYPFVSNLWNTYRQSRLITSYEQVLDAKTSESEIDYENEWSRAQAYNETLLPYKLPDSFAMAAIQDEPDEEYMACLNLTGDGMMGVVEIPKIDVKIPIYHTTSEDVLEKAAGHLEGSSLPIGGENTHSVISAHRGLPSAALFTDLDLLEEGDHFLIHVLDETLCYEVDMISIVEPSETEQLGVVDGEDHMTLLTCTPYGVNSHRLLVRGTRVEYVEEIIEEEHDLMTTKSVHTNYLLWVVVGLSITAVFVVGLFIVDKALKKRKNKQPKED